MLTVFKQSNDADVQPLKLALAYCLCHAARRCCCAPSRLQASSMPSTSSASIELLMLDVVEDQPSMLASDRCS
jgi:hypothetical protein